LAPLDVWGGGSPPSGKVGLRCGVTLPKVRIDLLLIYSLRATFWPPWLPYKAHRNHPITGHRPLYFCLLQRVGLLILASFNPVLGSHRTPKAFRCTRYRELTSCNPLYWISLRPVRSHNSTQLTKKYLSFTNEIFLPNYIISLLKSF